MNGYTLTAIIVICYFVYRAIDNYFSYKAGEKQFEETRRRHKGEN